MSKKVVDEFESSGHVPPAQKITMVAGPNAPPFLDFNYPVKGTDGAFGFPIACDLRDPTSRLPQECSIPLIAVFGA